MRARHRGVRSHAHGLTVAGATAMLVLLTACGGGSSGAKSSALDGQDTDAGSTQAAPSTAGSPAAGAVGASPGAKAAPTATTAASAGAQQPGTTKAGRSGDSRATAAATTAAQQQTTATTTKAIVVDAKCRKPASSVGSGVALKGQRPPGFTATTVDCGSLDFESYTKGKPTLVTFFAAWCEPCHKEAKDLEAVYEEYHASKGFTVVGVDTQDEDGNPTWFYDTAHWSFPSVWDDKEKIEKAWNSAGVISTLPASFWIHPDGTISSTIIGEMSRSQMEDEFNKL